jgi:uncharacterized protein DUF6625
VSERRGHRRSPSVLLISAYLGSLPVWYPAFLASCRTNEAIEWLVVTDAAPPHGVSNVRHRTMERDEFESLVADRLRARLDLGSNPRKICDLKPAFGRLFSEDVASFDYWGHCDLDVVWGDLRRALDAPFHAGADVVSLRRHRLAGHLTVFRNSSYVNDLFSHGCEFARSCATSSVTMFDEIAMSALVAERAATSELRVSWPSFVLENEFRRVLRHQRAGWIWDRGRLTDPRNGRELAYLHFTDWQRTMVRCDVAEPHRVERFEVTAGGILNAVRGS